MLFTHQDPIEGKVGIGRLPSHIEPILQNISAHFFIPNPSASTYHVYYTNLDSPLKELFDQIQYHQWLSIGHPVISMNEIYYSNPRPHFEKTHLYGASANLIPHRDCILFFFPWIEFYRTIIGVSGVNNDTTTIFTKMNLEHKINPGDYMIFDFDRTTHQVVKTGNHYTPRVLLKLHSIVCNADFYGSHLYIRAVTYFYQSYYFIARYTEQIGTDPTTFAGFFYGLAWELPFYPAFKYTVVGSYMTLVYYHRNIDPIKQYVTPIYYMFSAYLCLVLTHWISNLFS